MVFRHSSINCLVRLILKSQSQKRLHGWSAYCFHFFNCSSIDLHLHNCRKSKESLTCLLHILLSLSCSCPLPWYISPKAVKPRYCQLATAIMNNAVITGRTVWHSNARSLLTSTFYFFYNFGWGYVCCLNVLCTFNLRPVSAWF